MRFLHNQEEKRMKKFTFSKAKKTSVILASSLVGLACIALPARALAEKSYSGYSVEQSIETAVIKQGSKGDEVKEVQRRLKEWGYYNGAVDGVFGAGTKSAVIAFQKKERLDGGRRCG